MIDHARRLRRSPTCTAPHGRSRDPCSVFATGISFVMSTFPLCARQAGPAVDGCMAASRSLTETRSAVGGRSRSWPLAKSHPEKARPTAVGQDICELWTRPSTWADFVSEVCRFELTPPTCPVVGDDRSEHCDQRLRVDRLSSTHGDCPCGLVLLARADDPVRVGNHRAVVEENVDVVLRGEQHAHVSVQEEERQLVALDRFGDLRVGSVDQGADLTDVLLPVRQRVDVGVYASISRVGHGSREDSPGGLGWQAQTPPPNRSRPRHHRRIKRRERDLRDHLTDQGRVI